MNAVHLLGKPTGAICNLDCAYCYYLEKEKLYPQGGAFRMGGEVLEAYVRQNLAQEGPEAHFTWQGGEPTLMGLDFFREAVALQKRLAPRGKRVFNAIQTNGTLLDDAWARFLHDEQFLVGLSLDGPEEIHDRYRVDKGGQPTFKKVMAGLAVLKKHQVEFNTLTVVNRHSARKPMEIYGFLKEQGSGYLQFLPLVERSAGDGLAGPAGVGPEGAVTAWSVLPEDYGDFLLRIFRHWAAHDVGKVFVQLFEVQLGIWMGRPSPLCIFSETCGKALALEHNGDLYSCDHYVYPRFKLGNLLSDSLGAMAASPEQRQFGLDKRDSLPAYCRSCEVRFACNGECPRHRFLSTPDGEPGLNYLCAGYKKFFKAIDGDMRRLAARFGA